MSENEAQPQAAGWIQRIMSTGLIGPDEVKRLMGGDVTVLMPVLPTLLRDPEFQAIPQIQGVLQAIQAGSGVEGQEGGAPAQRRETRGDSLPPTRGVGPGGTAPELLLTETIPFNQLGNDFGARICQLLASPKFGGQIQLNFEVTQRGIVFQVLRYVRDADGRPGLIPFSSPVKAAPREVGDWLKAVLKQTGLELRQQREDEEMLEAEEEDPQDLPPPPRRRERPQS